MCRLLQDSEQEVRQAAAGKVGDFSSALEQSTRSDVIINVLLEHLHRLHSDSSQHVRTALAKVLMGLAPLVGKQHTIQHFLPLYLNMLKDECAEVRLNIITSLDSLNSVIFLIVKKCLFQL